MGNGDGERERQHRTALTKGNLLQVIYKWQKTKDIHRTKTSKLAQWK